MSVNKNLIFSYLRCEYKTDPLGIDVARPRLSWVIESLDEERDQYQIAYQVIVSSSLESLAVDYGDVWDSGKVNSDSSNQVSYSGIKLQSGTTYWWKVRIWDKNDSVIQWSYPAKWVTGLLNKADWKAQWIGFDEWHKKQVTNEKKSFIENSDKWIWYPAGKNNKGKYFFRKSFIIDNINKIESADILVTADEGFTLYVNGKRISESDGKIFSWTRPQYLDIKAFLVTGKNIITLECINTYLDKPGLCLKLSINSGTRSRVLRTDNTWKTSAEEFYDWINVNFNDNEWINSEVVALMGDKPWSVPRSDLFLPPPAYLHKHFSVSKKVKYALVFVSALGLYKLFLNGKTVSEDRFTPGWTDYNKRVYYNTFDVTDLLLQNDNFIGVILADGWYSGYIGWEKRREYYGKVPQLLLQLEIMYDDGTSEIVFTDNTWKASYGAHLQADLLMGEAYHARRYPEGWLTKFFNVSEWKNINTYTHDNIELNSYPGIPVAKTAEIIPVSITPPGEGVYIIDLGQNIAGVARLKIDGTLTDKVTLRYGEMLDDKGRLYTENIRMARATDTYFTTGEKEEIWDPDFTYHGFRYIEIAGYPEYPAKDVVTGIVLGSDLPLTGTFKCSNEKLNKLYDSILWSQRANFFDIPTDCPQRDERLGWTADAVDFIRTAAFNMDISAFYTKWLRDLNDAQKENGAYPAIAPQPDLGVGPLYEGAAGWADSGIITPYVLFKFYGDKKVLECYYNNMLRYMTYLEQNSKNFLRIDYGYGDWLSVNADTPKDLINSGFYAYDAMIMEEISLLLNRKNEADWFSGLYKNIKSAFIKKYSDGKGSLNIKTQTAFLLALYFGLTDGKNKHIIFNELLKDIEERDYHVSTGFIGLAYLFPVLARHGRSDIIYKILLNESYPSWLNMLNNGATTMWERWDSWSPENGFFDPLMNSFNHTSLGVIGEWLYTGIGGINSLAPGFKKILIKPLISEDISFADVSYNSVNGLIRSSWKIVKNNLFINILIPVNVSAKIVLPKNPGSRIVSQKELLFGESEKFYFMETGSGKYELEIQNLQ